MYIVSRNLSMDRPGGTGVSLYQLAVPSEGISVFNRNAGARGGRRMPR